MIRIVLLAAIMAVVGLASAQHVVRDDWQGIQVQYSNEGLSMESISVEGRQFATLHIDGCMPSGEVGAPMLPAYSALIEVPLCKTFDIRVIGATYDTLWLDSPLLPMQPSRSKSDTARHPLVLDAKAYAIDGDMGGGYSIEPIGISRDRRLARLQFTPFSYNPVSGRLVRCLKATLEVTYVDVDQEATLSMFNRYHSPAFNSASSTINNLYPKSVNNTAPIRYLIVAHSQFRGYLDQFVQWKRRKGFITDVAYTDDPGMGTTTTAIQSYLQGQYTNATVDNPAPTYLLIVGDVDQIPPFEGTTDDDHVTDLYYTTWTTGDHLPDCYYGRFSAQNTSQLTPQIDKTLMYEQYTFADPAFLDRAVMVAGVDGGSDGDYGYTHADPAMDYAITNYINGAHGFSDVRYFKNNTSIVPSGVTNVTVASSASSMSATVRSYYNNGAGWINYSAHGGSTGWGTPSFYTSDVDQMTNVQKFGLMIGNCCLTNKFEVGTCLGESLLRKGNYCGAVGYIGGSNSTYWYEDFYWAVGIRSGIGPSMSMAYNSSNLGAYDRICHTHGESYSQWVTTQGALMMMGNMAVEGSTSGRTHYYWEIYHLMGDPSVMPYLTQADEMTLTAPSVIVFGSSQLQVTAAPYSYVALTDTATHMLQAAAYANASGQATLSLPTAMPMGTYELAVSAQQYRTAFQYINMIQPDGAFPMVSSVAPSTQLLPGDTVTLVVTIENPGNAAATSVVAHLSSDSPMLTLLTDSLVIASIAAGQQLTFSNQVLAVVDPSAEDGTMVNVSTTVDWVGCTLQSTGLMHLTICSPKPVMQLGRTAFSVLPSGTIAVDVEVGNQGHADLPASSLVLSSPTSLVQPASAVELPILHSGDTASRQLQISTDASLPTGVEIPIHLALVGDVTYAEGDIIMYIGNSYLETFEPGVDNISGWSAGSNLAWSITDDLSYEGSYSRRSSSTITHNQTSELSITFTSTISDSVGFYYSVSSENNYDKFHFFIDDEDKLTESGDVSWTHAAFPISAGSHTIKFTYAKDYSVSRGSDCAWVDMIQLPHAVRNVSFNSVDLCQNDVYVVDGDTLDTHLSGVNSFVDVASDQSVSLTDIVIHPSSNENVVAEACDSYLYSDSLYTQSCSMSALYSNIYGCDSAVALHLTIHHSSESENRIDACDSCVYNDVLYTSSCSMSTLYSSVYGCDSLVQVKIVIHPSKHVSVDATAASSYNWNGTTYTESGDYTAQFTTIYGCDSVVTLHLTIDNNTPEGIDGIENIDVQVWPNPTTGMINFGTYVDNVSIYDALGRRVAEYSGVQRVDMSMLPAGSYIVKLSIFGSEATMHILKQ